MKKSISGWLAVLGLALGLTFSAAASAESEGIAWDKAPNKTTDVAALQNGARRFKACSASRRYVVILPP